MTFTFLGLAAASVLCPFASSLSRSPIERAYRLSRCSYQAAIWKWGHGGMLDVLREDGRTEEGRNFHLVSGRS